jgi:signal transduction histidine kinase
LRAPLTPLARLASLALGPGLLVAASLIGAESLVVANEADRRRREAEASRDQLGVLMVQQAALRRVATLVARGVRSGEVFSAVVRELSHCLGVSRSALVRYEPGCATVILAGLGQPGLTKTQDSQRFSLAHIRTLDIGNEVGARRRFERDLHDGAQQRLVSLELDLRNAEASLPPEMHPIKKQVSTVAGGLAGVLEDLQRISRGIHPAMLSKAGLGPALKRWRAALRSRSSSISV